MGTDVEQQPPNDKEPELQFDEYRGEMWMTLTGTWAALGLARHIVVVDRVLAATALD